MLPKSKALYQVKLILDYLPEDEYKLIPQETIDYIENNYKYDENIVIDPEYPCINYNKIPSNDKQVFHNKTLLFFI